MDKCREAFEKTPEIAKRISKGVYFNEDLKIYREIKGSCRGATFVNGAWCVWQSRQAEVEEKDKRIKELERSCISYKNQRDDYAQKLMVKSVHYSSIQEELAKLKDRLELAHHLATQSTWSSLKQLKKVVKALRGEHE